MKNALPATALAFLALTGCRGESTRAPEATPAPQGLRSPEATQGQVSRNVQVTLADYRIDMPATLSAGTVELQVRNQGSHEHSLEVEGQGLEKELSSRLQPGQQGTLRVDLSPGEYRVYCPVGDHAQRGMSLQLVVTR